LAIGIYRVKKYKLFGSAKLPWMQVSPIIQII